MAQVQVVAAPPIEWPYRVEFPGADGTGNNRERNNFQNQIDAARMGRVGDGDVGAAGRQEAGSTGQDFFTIRDGVTCMRTTTAPRSWGWSFGWWTPVFDGTALPAGYQQPVGNLVAVLDAYLRYDFTTPTTGDVVGCYIGGALGATSGEVFRTQTPNGGGAAFRTGGAGFLLDAGGGGYDFVTWDRPTRTVQNRIAGVAPDPTVWNVFRFVIISAQPGEFATFQAYHNGTLVVEDTYGSATLPIPFEPDAPGPANGELVLPALAFVGNPITPPSGMCYAMAGKWGRYTLDGVPVQGE